jgi:hypothetical protein
MKEQLDMNVLHLTSMIDGELKSKMENSDDLIELNGNINYMRCSE